MADPNLTLQDWMSPAGINKWLAELGVNDAPVPREHAQAALWFFHRHMPKLPPSMAEDFLLAIESGLTV